MARGTISRIVRREFGFISPDGGGVDVYFRLEWVREAPASGVAVGDAVEYQVRETPRGPQTQWVRFLPREQPALTTPAPGYRFLNPYNFVRALPQREGGDALLGRCPPPPHDRYLGLSGRITCELTATTPIFVADSEEVYPDKERPDHYHYHFFRYGGREAIPGTSLRGAIRSVFEAATNSCMGVFAGHRRLSRRFDSRKAPQLVPARVERDGESWQLRLLTGTTPLQIGRPPSGPQYAAWLYRYWPMCPSKTLTQTPPANARVSNLQRRRRKGQPISLDGLAHGDQCYALLERVQHPLPSIEFWDVVAVSRDRASLEQGKKPGQRIEEGYLGLNNQNVEPKHSERFFFRAAENQVGAEYVPLGARERKAYEELIADYQDRHRDIVARRKRQAQEQQRPSERVLAEPASSKDAGLSRFVYTAESARLREGDLVYAFLRGAPDHPEVEFIVPVSVPRVGYKSRIGDKIGELLAGLRKCDRPEHLCPACRVFGWVWGTGDPEEKAPGLEVATAYAGRVRFSHAALLDEEPRILESSRGGGLPLAILSAPKPTTVRFYLADKDGRAQDGLEDDQVDYDAPRQVLRGRKFYRHHGDRCNEREYRRAEGKRDDQNRTLHGVLERGSRFAFTVDFENLSPVELGALLWSLEIEGWHHRLGLGKPLGLGSATIRVQELQVLSPEERYSGLEGGWHMVDKEGYVRRFKKAMAERYGAFDTLPNIRDLRALLSETPPLPVHYPRTGEKPSAEGKNFEWFMGNKRAGREAGPRLTLRPADEDTQGLPLMDKDGRIKR